MKILAKTSIKNIGSEVVVNKVVGKVVNRLTKHSNLTKV